MNAAEKQDKLDRAREFADKLGQRNGYHYVEWMGKRGLCCAGFEREGELWSFPFMWQQHEGFDALQERIEKLDFMLVVAQKDFAALKFGAAMRAAGHSAPQMMGSA